MNCCDPLTDDQRAALAAQLADAEKAYHQLMIGGGVAAFTDQNGERVEYRASNRTSLLSYINFLRGQLGMRPMRGVVGSPIGFYL